MSAIADLSTAGTGEEREGFIVFDTFRWRRGGGGGGSKGQMCRGADGDGRCQPRVRVYFLPARLARERLLHTVTRTVFLAKFTFQALGQRGRP